MSYLIWTGTAILALGILWWKMRNSVSHRKVRKIVTLRPETTIEDAKTSINQLGGTFIRTLPLINAIVCELPAEKEISLLSADTAILRVDDDIKIRAVPTRACWSWWHRIPSQPRQSLPWGVRYIHASEVWDRVTGANVKVAVLDTGIDYNHPDLKNVVKGGYNALGGRSFWDDNGHGTHVAGVISANNNRVGVVGVAPDAELYAVKVLDKNGGGNLSDLVDGLQWCLENGIQVANLSLGAPRGNETLREVVERSVEKGLVLVAAAGNEGPSENTVNYPAKYHAVLAVAACDSRGKIPSFSSRGPEIDITAPGTGITSTWPRGKYRSLSGTSMASPHVAGTAALLLQAFPHLSPSDITQIVTKTAQKTSGTAEVEQGAGIVNVTRALAAADKLMSGNFPGDGNSPREAE